MVQEADTEKITLNMLPVDLGRIDLLVSQGAYASRSDFIRTAIRRQLEEHAGLVEESVAREAFSVGSMTYGREWFERQRRPVRVRILGMLRITSDVSPELADRVIEHLSIRGILRAPPDVLARLGGKVDRGIRVNRGG